MKNIIEYLNEKAPDLETYYRTVCDIHVELACETIGNWAKREKVDLHATDENGKNIFINWLTGNI